jgi:hypothetical protein
VCRAGHFEAQFYERESKLKTSGGQAVSLGVFPFPSLDPEAMARAAKCAAQAADRATVKFFELKGVRAEEIQARLNVRECSQLR